MISQNRLLSLRNFHEQLERAIHDEQKRPYPDHGHIKRMKIKKLSLKDEIEVLTDPAETGQPIREMVAA